MADERTRALVRPSSEVIVRTHVEPKDDMAAERARASFDNQPLLHLLSGGKEKVDKRRKFADILAKTTWGDKTKRYFLSREEEYVGGLKAALGIWGKMQGEGLSLEDGALMRSLVDFPGGLELHIGMFIPSIISQGSKEQQAHWMPRCMGLEIIGTYAQTELGHGTFVRGLETTATYDPQTEEFVVHSPTLTATKWWPGGLGKTSTHAIVMARLFTQGKDYGPHGFVMQIRTMDTHLPLTGVTIGDIGPKAGYNGVDNGYMSFDHVRIPREAMLMRFSQVTPDGKYVPPPPANAKASYATMLFVRADIVKNAGGCMAKAVTIATRYAAVRRQTAPKPGEREVQVLDYQNVANTLLPLVANAYAMHFMGEEMMAMYKSFEKARNAGDFSALPELHALSSGLKATCTWITADGIEECRRTCGGHGYSRLSGLPSLFVNYVQNVTWEGDNNVLCLQTARFLLKSALAAMAKQPAAAAAAAAGHSGTTHHSLHSASSSSGSASASSSSSSASSARGASGPASTSDAGSVSGSAAYLANAQAELRTRCIVSSAAGWRLAAGQLAALRHVATGHAAGCLQLLAQAGGGKPVFEGPAWNSNTVDLIRLAKAHCTYVLMLNFHNTLQALEARHALDNSTLSVLRDVASLASLSALERAAGDLMQDGYATGSQLAALRSAQRDLLTALRPNAVALVDSFGFVDYELHSALGREDGDVYRGLLDMAKNKLALNASEEGPAWEDVLKPVLAPRSKL